MVPRIYKSMIEIPRICGSSKTALLFMQCRHSEAQTRNWSLVVDNAGQYWLSVVSSPDPPRHDPSENLTRLSAHRTSNYGSLNQVKQSM